MYMKFTVFWCFLGLFVVSINAQSLPKKGGKYNKKDSVYYAYKNELEIAQKSHDFKAESLLYIRFGIFFKDSGIYPEATKQFNAADDLAKKLDNDSIQIAVQNQLAEVCLLLKNYDKAIEYLTQASSKASKFKFIEMEAIAEELLGTCYEKKSNYLQALHHQENSLLLFNSMQQQEGIAIVNENIGSIYEDLEQYDTARAYFQKAYEFFVAMNHEGQMNVLNNLGDTYRKQGLYAKGLTYTIQAKELAELWYDAHQLESAYRDMAKSYTETKAYEKAYNCLQKSNEIKEEQFYSQNFEQMNVLQTVYDTKVKEDKIQLLTQENKITKAQQNLMWFAIAVLVVGGIGFYLFLDRKRKSNSKLQEFEQRTIRAELKQKQIEEVNLQKEIQLKTASLSKYSLNLAQKNKLISEVALTLKNLSDRSRVDVPSKLKELAKQLEVSLQEDDEWEEFMHFFEDVHPDFIKKISNAASQKLTSTELRLAMLLRLNLSSKEIASVLRVTPDSVRVARYRLRKKLPIDQKEELISFMLEL